MGRAREKTQAEVGPSAFFLLSVTSPISLFARGNHRGLENSPAK
jgi:hypothetical protein